MDGSLSEIIDSGNISLLKQIYSKDSLTHYHIDGFFQVKNHSFDSMSLLQYTILRQKLDVASFLLSCSVPINEVYSGWTALHLASYLGLHDFVDLLLFYGANPILTSEKTTNETPLYIAIRQNDVKSVHSMLRALGTVSQPSLLHLAIRVGNPEIVKLLVLYGANPNQEDSSGKTSFQILQLPQQSEIEKILKNTRPLPFSPTNPDFDRFILFDTPINSLADLLAQVDVPEVEEEKINIPFYRA